MIVHVATVHAEITGNEIEVGFPVAARESHKRRESRILASWLLSHFLQTWQVVFSSLLNGYGRRSPNGLYYLPPSLRG